MPRLTYRHDKLDNERMCSVVQTFEFEHAYEQSITGRANLVHHHSYVGRPNDRHRRIDAIPAVVTPTCGADGAHLTVVRRAFDEGVGHLRERNYRDTIRVFRAGVNKLGAAYASPGVLDDTGYRIVLASTEERNRRHSIAAHLLEAALESRLSMCERKLASFRGKSAHDGG